MQSLRRLVEDLSRENESLQDESRYLNQELHQSQQQIVDDQATIHQLKEHRRLLVSALEKSHQERVSKSYPPLHDYGIPGLNDLHYHL